MIHAIQTENPVPIESCSHAGRERCSNHIRAHERSNARLSDYGALRPSGRYGPRTRCDCAKEGICEKFVKLGQT
jgi:hypothetical protein